MSYTVFPHDKGYSFYFEHDSDEDHTFRIVVAMRHDRGDAVVEVAVVEYDLVFDLEPFFPAIRQYFATAYPHATVSFSEL